MKSGAMGNMITDGVMGHTIIKYKNKNKNKQPSEVERRTNSFQKSRRQTDSTKDGMRLPLVCSVKKTSGSQAEVLDVLEGHWKLGRRTDVPLQKGGLLLVLLPSKREGVSLLVPSPSKRERGGGLPLVVLLLSKREEGVYPSLYHCC